MKKIMLILALIASVAMGAVAQPRKLTEEDKERFLNGKAKMIQKELNISDEQMVKFLPIYKDFQKELKDIKHDRVKSDTLTMDAAYASVMGRLEYQENVIKVQKNTLKELKSVLTPVQLRKFLDAERKVQKNIMKHKRDRKGHKMDSMKRKMERRERRKMNAESRHHKKFSRE